MHFLWRFTAGKTLCILDNITNCIRAPFAGSPEAAANSKQASKQSMQHSGAEEKCCTRNYPPCAAVCAPHIAAVVPNSFIFYARAVFGRAIRSYVEFYFHTRLKNEEWANQYEVVSAWFLKIGLLIILDHIGVLIQTQTYIRNINHVPAVVAISYQNTPAKVGGESIKFPVQNMRAKSRIQFRQVWYVNCAVAHHNRPSKPHIGFEV